MVVTSEKLPIKIWSDDIDDTAFSQLEELANHPCLKYHIAAMPDVHAGCGMPIGGVIASESLIPSAVGVDIGCGMMALKTNQKDYDKETLQKIITELKVRIPVGFNHRKKPVEWFGFTASPRDKIIQDNLISARYQLGTLGGGNHFLEIQKDEEGYIWLMVHCGSRNIGYKIASHYMVVARDLCEKYHSNIPLPKKDHLAFLPDNTKEFWEYYRSLIFALDFAKMNRKIILSDAFEVFSSVFPNILISQLINVHHNYASSEDVFGSKLWVHRKGATAAYKGQLGIIPGSMGTSSYIVEGLGNKESFNSCSHGAGRRMGRKQFMRETSLDDCNHKIKDIVFSGWGTDRKGNVDYSEAPDAYKNIDDVMNNQKDLVKVVHKLIPLAVLKG